MNLKTFPKKLEKFQNIWKLFEINSKTIGIIFKNNGNFPNNWNQFEIISKKVRKIPRYLESIP